MLPLVPAGTIAALDLMRPSSELSVEATGRDCPAGHTVRYPSVVVGTTATLREYASAVEGMPQALVRMLKSRLDPPVMLGPPNGPAAVRVSATRQAVTGMKRSPLAPAPELITVESVVLAATEPPPDTPTLFTDRKS